MPDTVTYVVQDICGGLLVRSDVLSEFAASLSRCPGVRRASVAGSSVHCVVERESLDAVERAVSSATWSIETMGERREVVGVDMPPLRADYVWQTVNDARLRSGGM